jgi:hypothetical protein
MENKAQQRVCCCSMVVNVWPQINAPADTQTGVQRRARPSSSFPHRSAPFGAFLPLTRIAMSRKAVKAVNWSVLRRMGASRNPFDSTIPATNALLFTLYCGGWPKEEWGSFYGRALMAIEMC